MNEATRVGSVSPAIAMRVSVDVEFDGFYRMHRVEMVRLATLLTGSVEAAEDAVQESFVRVYQRWDRIDNPGGYLRTCVVNRCNSWHRRRVLSRRHEAATREAPAHQDRPDELAGALDELSRRARTVVVLRYYENLSTTEVATILGISEGTVKSTLARALTKLKGLLL